MSVVGVNEPRGQMLVIKNCIVEVEEDKFGSIKIK